MIAWLFFTFLSVGIVLMIAGFALDIPLLNLTGTTFIFLLGLNLLTNGLDYKAGEEEVYHYSNNLTGEHWTSSEPAPSNSSDNVYLFNKTIQNKTEFYDDSGTNRFGWFLLALGALAFALSMFML